MRKSLSSGGLRAVLMVLLVAFGVGNAWAHSTHYGKAVLNNATGNGTVYLSTSSSSNSGQTGTTGTAGAAGSTSYITWDCGKSSDKDSKTYYARGTANDGYYFAGYATSSTATSYTASTTGWSPNKASSTSSGSPTTSTIYGFFKPVTVTAAPSNVNINPTDPSATYNDAAGTVVSFTTANSNKIGDFTTSESGDARWVISAWTRASASSATFNYKFVGNGSYGTNNRTFTKTVTLTSKGDASSAKTCTLTAKYPNPRVVACDAEATDLTIYPTFKAADATQAAVEKTAVFDVVYADNANNFSAAFSGATGSGAWDVTGISVDQASQKATVTYTFNGNKAVGTHTAVLTLTANNCQGWDDTSADGGASATVTLTAENSQEATNDASVTTTANVTTEYATFAEALAAANATSGATLTLLRNVDLGTITTTNNITKKMTIDLNGKELRAAVNATSVGILTITAAVPVTIKDSKTGGKIINEIARNSEIRTIFVNKAGATLTLESGTIAVNNTKQFRYGITDHTDGEANVVNCAARAIHQIAGSTVNINGGKVQSKASRNGYGIFQASSASTQRAGTTVLNISGGEIYSECSNRAYGVAAYGKVNLSGGTITAKLNTETVNANTVYVAYKPDDDSYVVHNYVYALQMNGGASVTAASNYYGVLNMTGGEVVAINENVHTTATRSLYIYGIFFNASSVNVKTGTASDGTYSQKWAAVGDISGGSVRVENTGTLAYGVFVAGEYNSHDDSHTVTKIKNFKVDVTAYQSAYGVYANASVGTTSNSASPNMGACYAGDVDLTNTTVNATTTDGTTAYALMVVSTYGTVFKNATMTKATDAGYTQVYDGEFASAAKMTVNSGTYTAETKKSSSAYAAASSTRSRTIFASTTSTNASRELGGHKQAYAELNIHGGTFTATTSTSEARAVSVGGHTTIDGGHFYANAGSSTARGIYCVSGTLKVSGVDVHSEANSSAFGISLSGGISDNTGFSYSADAELNNLTVDVRTRTGNEADGVLMEVTKKNLPTIPTSGEYMNMYQKGEYAIAPKAIINGGTYTVTSQGTSAYGVSLNSAPLCEDINGDGILAIGEGDLTIKNAEFTVKTKTGNAAYGVWAGGKTSVENTKFTITSATSDAYGLRAYYGKSTIKNSTFDVTATTATAVGLRAEARMSTVNSSNSHHTTNFSGVEGYDLIGEIESEGNTVTVRADGGNTAYGLQVISAKGTGTKTTAAAGLAFKGDHACAGSATINGGKYTATASGTTAYAVIVSAPATQGEKTAIPSCTVNDGKFYGYATGGTCADLSPAGEPGYFVLNGGYYVKDENIDVKLGDGMNKVEVKSGTPEYTEGYRWRVTDNMTGEIVCKVYKGTTLQNSWQSLEEALQYVNTNASSSNELVIVMCANYTLPKGDYLLPKYATLLLPYLSSGTGKGAVQPIGTSPVFQNQESVGYVSPTPLYKLVFASGVNMTVQGTIETSAVTFITNGAKGPNGVAAGLTSVGTGVVSGKYGWLQLDENSHIDLESEAKIQAWGYITGKGEINAKSGSTIYEDFQMGDWRGGSEEINVNGNKYGLQQKGVFLITHYYYQNIECAVTYRPGAFGKAYGGTYMNYVGNVATNAVNMVGTTDDSMFHMDKGADGESTWVRKEYDAGTDYMNWTLNSGASIGSISLAMDMGMFGDINLKSSDYVLPITSNFNIIANYGEVEISNDVCFLPGSRLTIKKEATIIIPYGQRVFFYDQDNWLSYGGYWFNPGYSPSWKTNPRRVLGANTSIKMPDAEVLVEGLLDIRGAAYTTAGGANIHSTRENAGKVKFGAALPAATAATGETTGSTTLYQWKAGGPKYDGKALNPAWLKNEDGTYSKPTSSNTSSGDTWVYMQSLTEDTYEWTKASEDGCFTIRSTGDTKTYVHPSDWVAVGAVNANHAYPSEDATRMFVNTEAASTSASCKWWDVNPTPEVIDGTTYYVANNENFDNFGTYYYWDNTTSYWKPKKITVTWRNEDGTKITNGTYGDLYSFNTSPQFFGTNPKKTPTAIEKYDWIGWRDAEGNIYDKNATLPRATSNVTYTAYFNTTKYQYTITFKNEDDNKVIWAGLMDAGDPAVCPIEPTQESTVSTVYTFSNWVGYATGATLPTITGPATYTAHYTTSTRQYHVTFYNYDAASVLYETDVDYNSRPVYDGVTPFRSNTSAFSYEWTGWQQGANNYGKTDDLAIVTGNINYIATFSQTDLKYQVFFKRQDGSIINAPFFSFEETPSAFPANPTLASTVSTDYTFDHWDPATLQPVTVDGMVYTAYFSETTRQYTAHFENYDGSSLGVDQTINYNTVPAYTGATPFHPNDSRNSYEFSGWAWEAGADWEAGSIGAGEAFPAIKGNITFIAQFSKTLLQFNVRYVREDGTPLKEEKLKWGESTTGFPSPVASYEDETYSYTFNHWDPATVVNPVAKDATYTAYFNQAIKTYSISNFGISPAGYGSISPASVSDIPVNSDISINGNKITVNGQIITANPTASDAQYTYEFDHWNNVPATVTGNVTNIQAVFTRTTNTYTVTWKNADGNILETDTDVPYGTTPTYDGVTPTKATDATYSYSFNGWSSAVGPISGNTTYTATYSTTPTVASVTANEITTYYKTLPEAFTAANSKSECTIRLLNNVSGISASGCQLTYTKANGICTLDLNNCTVSGSVQNASNPKMMQINATGATFTITDNSQDKGGKFQMTKSSARGTYYAIQVSAGTLVVNNGYIYSDNQTTLNGTGYTYGSNAIQLEAGTSLQVNGGKIESKALANARAINALGSSSVTITNGTFIATTTYNGSSDLSDLAATVYTDGGTTTINNGTFTATTAKSASHNIYATSASQTINVSGGKFEVSGGTTTQNINNATAASNMSLTGGYYSHNANLATYAKTPYHVLPLTGEDPYKYEVAEAYTITFNNYDNTPLQSSAVKKGATPVYSGETPTKAEDASYTYSFTGWSPAITKVTADATYTATFSQEKRKYNVTWTGESVIERTDEVAYGDTPCYGVEPTKVPDESQVYTFKWMNISNAEIGVKPVTCDVTYAGSFTGSPRPYTITFVNDNGVELQSSQVTYGSTPTYEETPASTKTDGTYNFIGWTPEIVAVSGAATYTATYEKVLLPVVVNQGEAETISVQSSTTTTIVEDGGILTVENNAKLTTVDLVLEATPSTSGEIIAPDEQEALVAHGTVTFKFSQPGGFKARTWYSVAVPWQVDVPHNAPAYTMPCDIYAKSGDGEFVRLNLGSTIDLLYYDGDERANHGPSDKCWKYVEDDGQNEVMMPGTAYMFMLLNEADTICFVRKNGTPLRTRTTNVVSHDSETTENQNWNGIANPATYHAYLDARGNAGDVILGYIYDGDMKNYKIVDMDTTKLVVGQAVYIQAPTEQTIVANPIEYDNPQQATNPAPRRVAANNRVKRYDVFLGTEEDNAVDRVIVRTDEDKEDEYVIAKDLIKFDISPKVAQIWANGYDDRLAMNTVAPVNDQAIYPLGIFIPQAGEYNLYVANEMAEDDNLYLTYDGRVIWNLGYAPYVLSLEKGVNEHYGLRLIHNTPGMEMDVDQVEATRAAQKMLIDQKVYILRGEQLYSITGQKAE